MEMNSRPQGTNSGSPRDPQERQRGRDGLTNPREAQSPSGGSGRTRGKYALPKVFSPTTTCRRIAMTR